MACVKVNRPQCDCGERINSRDECGKGSRQFRAINMSQVCKQDPKMSAEV